MPNWLDKFSGKLAPRLTWTRIVLAVAIAVTADGLQFALGPLGWVFVDGVIDVVAMICVMLILGFHPLLLPTFLVELIPVADAFLPTWIGCVVAVIALRRRQQAAEGSVSTTGNIEPKPLPEKLAKRPTEPNP